VNWAVIFFCACAAVLTAVLSALPPALAALGLSASEAARADSRSVAGSRGRSVMLRALVVAQVAIAFALVNGGALVSASYLKELSANRQLSTDHVLSAAMDLNGPAYKKGPDAVRFCEQLAERAEALPGAVAAGVTTRMPLEGGNNMTIRRDDQAFDGAVRRPLAEIAAVSPGFFAASGTAILEGRTLNSGDGEGTMIGVVINKALADKEWPGRDPIGRVVMGNERNPDFKCRVVGVAENVRQWGPKSDVNPAIYWPLGKAWGQQRFLLVRTAGDAGQLAGPMRALVTSMDRDIPLSQVRTLGELVRQDTRDDRVFAGIVDFFMATALCLVAVGLYGSLSYHVLRRTREIGVRLALGAGRRNILRLVFSKGLGWVGVGVVIGAGGSVALGAVIRSMVWGVAPVSVLALAGSSLVVAASAVAASWFPARRAAALDPMDALRSD
jgi:predicted permease